MDSIAIDVKGASTISNFSSAEISCKAKLSIFLPQETIDVIHAIPEKLASFQSGQVSFYNNSILWKDYNYTLKLSDDNKDISVTDRMEDNAPSKLYLIALLSVNKNELIVESNK